MKERGLRSSCTDRRILLTLLGGAACAPAHDGWWLHTTAGELLRLAGWLSFETAPSAGPTVLVGRLLLPAAGGLRPGSQALAGRAATAGPQLHSRGRPAPPPAGPHLPAPGPARGRPRRRGGYQGGRHAHRGSRLGPLVGHLTELIDHLAPYRRRPAVRQLTDHAAGLLQHQPELSCLVTSWCLPWGSGAPHCDAPTGYPTSVRKTSVYFHEVDARRLAMLAEREGVSQASVLRRAIRAYVPHPARLAGAAED
ncbi:MAG: ribbon-helix-helix domain-containing protein, partial [Acidobacteria bacterium]|nr:ribbon-helix-helix domain-containing protein [Acidobacteriota bacterium]